MLNFEYHLTYDEANDLSPVYRFTKIIEKFNNRDEAEMKKHEWKCNARKLHFHYKNLKVRKVVK